MAIELYRAYSDLGIAYQETGNYKKAVEFHKKLLEDGPNDKVRGHGYVEAAYCLANLGELEKAAEYNEMGLKIFEKLNDRDMMAGYWRIRGVIHRQKGEYDKSLESFKKSYRARRFLKGEVDEYRNDE